MIEIKLRDYQIKAKEATRALLSKHRSCLIVSPTGSGKGTMAADLINSATIKGNKVLFVVHRKEIVVDIAQRLLRAGVPTLYAHAGDRSFGDKTSPVQLGTIQTLSARDIQLSESRLVVIDEAHHATCESYRWLINTVPNAKIVGYTATPERQDKSPLGDCFESIYVVAQISELVNAGHLVPIDVYSPIAFDKRLATSIIGAYQKWCSGRQTVVFCASKTQAASAVIEFQKNGIAVDYIDASTPKNDRIKILERLKSGEIQVILNLLVLTEGVDVPTLSACILAKGVNSDGNMLQMVGRIRRPHPSKETCVLVDLAGSIHKELIGHPDDDREFSLSGKAINRSKTSVCFCMACGYTYMPPKGDHCPACDYEYPTHERDGWRVRQETIKKMIVNPAKDHEFQANLLKKLERESLKKGYKRGWVQQKFFAITGDRIK